MKKYEFKKIDADTTELKYKDKTLTIRKDVELMKKLQGVNAKAKTKMMIELSKQGLTKKDLTIEKKEGSKTYYDNSNLLEIEEQYVNEASLEVIDEVCVDMFGMSLTDLILDIGLDEKDTEEFGIQLVSILTGQKLETPSK
jgi:hypothetical protein